MQKDDLIKLAEALASVGFNIISFSWEKEPYESPHIETVKLEILKKVSKQDKSTNPVS